MLVKFPIDHCKPSNSLPRVIKMFYVTRHSIQTSYQPYLKHEKDNRNETDSWSGRTVKRTFRSPDRIPTTGPARRRRCAFRFHPSRPTLGLVPYRTDSSVPASHLLTRNHANPLWPDTYIAFLPESVDVDVRVYNKYYSNLLHENVCSISFKTPYWCSKCFMLILLLSQRSNIYTLKWK